MAQTLRLEQVIGATHQPTGVRPGDCDETVANAMRRISISDVGEALAMTIERSHKRFRGHHTQDKLAGPGETGQKNANPVDS
ncbi:hypothetical protein LOC72_28065 [Roseiconus lacunae]|nr:hypothetical protein [Roseiconus lacunae]